MSQAPRLVIRFRQDGTFEMVGEPIIPHVVVSKRRISHILPVNPIKRVAFRMLRAFFSDSGKVASWTRRWSGPWEVVMIGSGQRFIHTSRAECVRWEIEAANQAQVP